MLESARTDCTLQAVSEYPSQNPAMEPREDSWILTTTPTVLRCFIELMTRYYRQTSSLIPEMLGVFSDCICQHERETLARHGVLVLKELIVALDGTKPQEVCKN